MGKVLVLETNPQDMKFLMTLPKYCEYEFDFTSDPSYALTEIQLGEVDIFVCPYEMEVFKAEDILLTANMIPSRPLCILTSDGTNIPGLLSCVNNYSVFKLVVKPFQNILDLKEYIKDAYTKRTKFGLQSDDLILGLIGDSKERAFWEHHDRILDFRLLKIISGAYSGFRYHDKLRLDETSEEGRNLFAVTQFVKDSADELFKYTVGLGESFDKVVSLINEKSTRSRSNYFGVRCSNEVYENMVDRADVLFVLVMLHTFFKHSYNMYTCECDVTCDKGYFFIKIKATRLEGKSKEYELFKSEASFILSKITDKYTLNDGADSANIACIVKI